MCPRACVPSVTREARGRLAVLSRPRRRGRAARAGQGREAISVVNVAPVDSALSTQRGFHTHTLTWRVSHTHSPGQAPVDPGAPGIRAQAAGSICFPPRGDVVLRLPPTLGGVLQPAALVPPVAPATHGSQSTQLAACQSPRPGSPRPAVWLLVARALATKGNTTCSNTTLHQATAWTHTAPDPEALCRASGAPNHPSEASGPFSGPRLGEK